MSNQRRICFTDFSHDPFLLAERVAALTTELLVRWDYDRGAPVVSVTREIDNQSSVRIGVLVIELTGQDQ